MRSVSAAPQEFDMAGTGLDAQMFRRLQTCAYYYYAVHDGDPTPRGTTSRSFRITGYWVLCRIRDLPLSQLVDKAVHCSAQLACAQEFHSNFTVRTG